MSWNNAIDHHCCFIYLPTCYFYSKNTYQVNRAYSKIFQVVQFGRDTFQITTSTTIGIFETLNVHFINRFLLPPFPNDNIQEFLYVFHYVKKEYAKSVVLT